MQLTEEQRAVVQAPVSDLLVSAAAGSGKTAVMTERIVQRIVRGELDILSVLVMTFTEAAARQMKEKIAAKLEEARASQTDLVKRRYLGRQQTLLPSAAISTIHAFCLTVIRNFSHLAVNEAGQLQVEPGFSVSDPQVADLLLKETLDDVLTRRYEAIDLAPEGEAPDWLEAFYHLVDSYSTSRSDDPLRQQVIRLYQYLRSLPDYRAEVARYSDELAEAARDFSASRHAAVLMAQVRVLLGQAVQALPELRDLLAGGVTLIKDPVRNQVYHDQFRRIDACLCQIADKLAKPQPDWDELVELARGLDDLDLPRAGGKDPGKARILELLRQNLAEAIHCLTGQCRTETYRQHFLFDTICLFNRSASQIEQEIRSMLPAIGQLFDLVLELDDCYRERKREQRLVDFGDFEHLALGILRQPEASDYYRQRCQEIYIDEYQDTSSIQEAILQAIAQGNVFMVGDVKQSIYRFRHARPGIFISRFEQYRQAGMGSLITLNRNFRSVPGVLGAVNEVFAQLMSPEAGEIDYSDGHGLVPHRNELYDAVSVELCLVQQGEVVETETAGAEGDEVLPPGDTLMDEPFSEPTADGEDTGLDAAELGLYEREARVVSQRIVQLVTEQAVEPCGIVILARTRAVVRLHAAALRERSIAVIEDTGRALFDHPDLRLLKALLMTMDNPRQDIPLAAVLKSGLLGSAFSPHELLAIRVSTQRAQAPCRHFHEAVAWYSAHGPDPDLKARLGHFLQELEQWRDREKFRKTGEWLEWLLEDTGFFHQVAAHENGAERLREVRAFIGWVHQFETNRGRGLFDLVRHIENLEQKGLGQAPYDLAESEQNAVRVMTIHSSKGLEFPVVFVVGLSGRITPKDQQDVLMISESLGVGFDWVDPRAHLRRTTHLKLAMLAEHKAQTLAEELRLLYVAMTRARDSLVLVAMLPKGSQKALLARFNKAQAWPEPVLPAHLVLSGRSYLDWLLMALARHPDIDWSRLAGEEAVEKPPVFRLHEPTQGVWAVQFLPVQDYLPSDREPLDEVASDEANPADVLDLPRAVGAYLAAEPVPEAEIGQALHRISPDYPFASAAKSPVKLSVSELKRREQEESLFGEEQMIELPGQDPALGINLDLHDLSELTEISQVPVQGARLGTALHLFLRYLDLPRARSEASRAELECQLRQLEQDQVLSGDEALALTGWLDAILAFVTSDLAGRMVVAERDRHQLFREMPFTLAVPAGSVWPGETAFAPDDRALVQGIIDCWFQENGQAILVDYKTDRATGQPEQIRQLLSERYGRQLDYYAQAISAGTGLFVTERLIVHVPSCQIFACPALEVEA
ncbi:MAG: helicase-exonuclease AddAB subunit AddA [Clostridia bacterium]|nr:helicase-exonuclease AddAB subunit AddA [Clostridia bacterium]NCC75023.1 helicase-exonuclease AddAB subunit AddA [Clostridia bacterium]